MSELYVPGRYGDVSYCNLSYMYVEKKIKRPYPSFLQLVYHIEYVSQTDIL